MVVVDPRWASAGLKEDPADPATGDATGGGKLDGIEPHLRRTAVAGEETPAATVRTPALCSRSLHRQRSRPLGALGGLKADLIALDEIAKRFALCQLALVEEVIFAVFSRDNVPALGVLKHFDRA